ncbi:MAG TPA: protein kinase [Gemmataceae bacterium]|jgi:serine/threonine-protein kinase|nr:protein kinase [Gemmataceae bacterium]
MVTSLGGCDAFVRNLRRSNLIDASRLDQVVGGYMRVHFRAEPSGLANYLVSEEVLTAFQAERLLKGDTQDLVLGPYVLTDLAGFGSTGPVYKALSKNDNRWYAIKVLPRRSMWNVLLAKRQARAFDKIQHPGIVPFADIGTAGSQHYLAWPFAEGETLDKIVEREGKLPSGLVAHYGYQIAEALFVCHQQDLFHGMLKPSNVMVDAEHHVRLLDFGVGAIFAANPEDQSLFNTQGQASLMTSGLDCASPESITDSSHLDAVGDQYSLGCILYFCLADRFPFEGQPVEKMVAHQTKQPTPLAELNPDVRRELAAIVARLMQKSPHARFVDAGEAARALKPLAFVPAMRSVPLAPVAPLPRPSAPAPRLPTREKTAASEVTKDTKEMLAPPAEVTPPPFIKETSPPFISSLPPLTQSPTLWVRILHWLRLAGTCLAVLMMLFLAWWFFWRR